MVQMWLYAEKTQSPWANVVGASSPRDLLRKLKPAFRSCNLRTEAYLNAVAAALRRDRMVQMWLYAEKTQSPWANVVGASSPRDLLRKLKPAFRSCNLRTEAYLNAVAAALRRDRMVQTWF
ncbi:hypothetical protein CKO50_02775 [Pseudoalteromonas sp. HM-SA03]|nr:hypothetical protein CKO50_02775 [Pseudoalteromonas sp. HM-SA03]